MKSQKEMNILVPRKLREIEEKYRIEILWAVESGSRAWGFESPDSDFDVRFIYKRHTEEYLKLNPDRDVIEFSVDETWDISGWDLDKTLKLLAKSNPTLYEWLQSPIVYIHSDFAKRIQDLLNHCFNEKSMIYHYQSTALKNFKRNIAEKDQVIPKKYFYVLRPLLACQWVQTYHTAPPVLFDDLVKKFLPKHMKTIVDQLLVMKMENNEGSTISPINELDNYLHHLLDETDQYLAEHSVKVEVDWDRLNRFFVEEIARQ